MQTTEFALIDRYFSHLGGGAAVDLSVGDDCAILQLAAGERLATSVDTMVAGVHFPPETCPEDIGFRAVSVAASDLAAMGAKPLAITVALTLPESDALWLHAFSQGLAEAVSTFQLPLVGGDTTRGPLTISVQVMGTLPIGHGLLRDGAGIGDAVYVSGTLGDAAAALACSQGRWQPAPAHAEYLRERFNRPRARLALGQQLLGQATAAIDISDGLLADAGHLAAASGVKICIDPQCLPLSSAVSSHTCAATIVQWALTGGDDYELLFSLPEGMPPVAGTTRIGQVVSGAGVDCGLDIDTAPGYQHFSD